MFGEVICGVWRSDLRYVTEVICGKVREQQISGCRSAAARGSVFFGFELFAGFGFRLFDAFFGSGKIFRHGAAESFDRFSNGFADQIVCGIGFLRGVRSFAAHFLRSV